jgi:hypothetical protein
MKRLSGEFILASQPNMSNPQYSPNVSTYHSPHHPSSQQPGVSTDASVIRMKDLEIQTLLASALLADHLC